MINKISITGDLGSGKSTIAKILAEEFNIQYLSTGAIQRSIAARFGMNTLQLNKYADTHKEIDDEIDNILRGYNDTDKSFVIDSRLAWFFIPRSFKIFFTIDIEVAGERVINDSARISEEYTSVEDAITNIAARKKSENERFLKQYKANCADMQNFDFVINTTELKTIIISKFIVDVINKHVMSNRDVMWCNPKVLFPTHNAGEVIETKESKDLRKIIKKERFSIDFPVKVVEKRGKLAILDGHKRTSAAIFANINLIPVKVIARNEELLPSGKSASQFFEESLNNISIKDWEKAHKFIFYKHL
jgi:CMP/dCMP kinase